MQIKAITSIGDSLSIITDTGESAVLYKFGEAIYTTVSDGLLKKNLSEFKKDVKKYDWDENKLRNIWITKE